MGGDLVAVRTPKAGGARSARLSKPGSSLLVASGIATALGLAWGNYHYLFMGFALLAILGVGWAMRPPRVAVERRLDRAKARIGELVTVSLRVRFERAPGWSAGPVLLRDEWPEVFALAAGSNVHLVWPGERERTFTYQMRCTRRGEFELPPTQATWVHPLRFRPGTVREAGHATKLVVEPRLRPVRRIYGVRAMASLPRPDEDRAFVGLESNQFREVREYQAGDALRRVNWKASARRSTGHDVELMVNEYEREGRKAVWFYLDCAAYMEVGTTESTVLDHALGALLEMVAYFADRGYRIGGAVYNAHEKRLFHPETGRRPFVLMAKHLMGVGPAAEGEREGLPEAVERTKHFLLRERPLVMVFTRPEADMRATEEGLRTLRRYTRASTVTSGGRPNGQARSPVWVLVPRISGAAARAGLAAEREHAAAVSIAGSAPTPGPGPERILPVSGRLAEAWAAKERASLRSLGVALIEWEPDREPVHGLLVRGAKLLASGGVRA